MATSTPRCPAQLGEDPLGHHRRELEIARYADLVLEYLRVPNMFKKPPTISVDRPPWVDPRKELEWRTALAEKAMVTNVLHAAKGWDPTQVSSLFQWQRNEGVNMVSKHTKPNAANPQGGIIKQESSIHLSNLMLIDPKSGEMTRVGRRIDESTGKLVRYSKKSGELIK